MEETRVGLAAVEERDPVPASQRGLDQMPPQEARPADDEDVHNRFSPLF